MVGFICKSKYTCFSINKWFNEWYFSVEYKIKLYFSMIFVIYFLWQLIGFIEKYTLTWYDVKLSVNECTMWFGGDCGWVVKLTGMKIGTLLLTFFDDIDEEDDGKIFADFSLSVSDDVIDGVRLYGVHNIDDIASLTSVGRRDRSIVIDIQLKNIERNW